MIIGYTIAVMYTGLHFLKNCEKIMKFSHQFECYCTKLPSIKPVQNKMFATNFNHKNHFFPSTRNITNPCARGSTEDATLAIRCDLCENGGSAKHFYLYKIIGYATYDADTTSQYLQIGKGRMIEPMTENSTPIVLTKEEALYSRLNDPCESLERACKELADYLINRTFRTSVFCANCNKNTTRFLPVHCADASLSSYVSSPTARGWYNYTQPGICHCGSPSSAGGELLGEGEHRTLTLASINLRKQAYCQSLEKIPDEQCTPNIKRLKQYVVAHKLAPRPKRLILK